MENTVLLHKQERPNCAQFNNFFYYTTQRLKAGGGGEGKRGDTN